MENPFFCGVFGTSLLSFVRQLPNARGSTKEWVFLLSPESQVVKISERMLEDWICENPRGTIDANAVIIGRQIPLSHGRLDILAWDGRVNVIELKAESIKERDIAQVGRYAYDISSIMNHVGIHYKPKPKDGIRTLTYEFFEEEWRKLHGNDSSYSVWPMLIGTSIDENTLAAAYGVGVEIRTWHYDKREQKIMVNLPGEIKLRKHRQDATEWALRLSNLIKDECVETANRKFVWQIRDLFGVAPPK